MKWLSPKKTPANGYVAEEGRLNTEEIVEVIEFIKKNLKITSATIASFDPQYDPHGKTLQVGLKLVRTIVHK